jgi:hypothetical protein
VFAVAACALLMVTTSHLPRGNPGSVDRMVRENDMTLGNQLTRAVVFAL